MSEKSQSQTAVPANDVYPHSTPEMNQALVALCSAVLPVWGRQLATSRAQSEGAVSEMISAFAKIGPHLDMAVRQSRQITAALSSDGDGMVSVAQACENELAPLLARVDADAVAAISRVMAMIAQSVSALEQVAKPFEHETQMVGQQVERMYVGFQYQDRTSQMMTLLHEDIQRLHAVMADPGIDAEALGQDVWLHRLESQYATAEQRQDHVADAASSQAQFPATDIETTFF